MKEVLNKPYIFYNFVLRKIVLSKWDWMIWFEILTNVTLTYMKRNFLEKIRHAVVTPLMFFMGGRRGEWVWFTYRRGWSKYFWIFDKEKTKEKIIWEKPLDDPNSDFIWHLKEFSNDNSLYLVAMEWMCRTSVQTFFEFTVVPSFVLILAIVNWDSENLLSLKVFVGNGWAHFLNEKMDIVFNVVNRT